MFVSLFFFIFLLQCVRQEFTLFTPLSLKKIGRPVLVSAVKFSVKLLSANMGFVNFSGLKFSPDFQNTCRPRGLQLYYK